MSLKQDGLYGLRRIETAGNADLVRLADLRNHVCDLIAHELKGPLTSITGFSARALRSGTKFPPEIGEALTIIHQQAIEMAFRIDLLLSASELDGPYPALDHYQLEAVAIDELLDQEVHVVRHKHPAAEIHAKYPTGLLIRSEPHRIREIIANLLDNACKYGGGTIVLTAEYTAEELLVCVHDDGSGIPEDERPSIFERGYRTSAARSGGREGTGLGLFVAHQLARHLGGSLAHSNSTSHGTDFILRLPLSGPDL